MKDKVPYPKVFCEDVGPQKGEEKGSRQRNG